MALKVKTYNNVQANVTFSKASSRVEINPTAGAAATENIALTLGKISKWYDSLVPTGGSSGKILVYNSSGTAKWNDPLHPTITKSADTTSTVSPAHGGTFTTVDSVTRDANGHVTKINTKTVTLPSDQNTDTKATQSSTTTTDYRPITLGAKNTTTVSQLDATVTDQVYTSQNFFVKPSSGVMFATEFMTKSYLTGTGSDLGQYGLYLKSYLKRADNTEALYSDYVVRTYNGKISSNDGLLVTVGGGGLTILGGGESAGALAGLISDDQTADGATKLNVGGNLNTAFTGNSERAIISSDDAIYFITNCQTIANRKPVCLDTNLYFYPGTNDTGSLGTSSYRWNTVYANVVYGVDHKTIGTSHGYYLKDQSGTEYGGVYDNGSNLWIGSTMSSNRHHKGSTYISTGWTGTLPTTSGGTLTGNSSVLISVPKYTATSATAGTWDHTAYYALHSGNFTTTGSGNAVTSVAFTNEKLTFTKGSTFSLSSHTHDSLYAVSSSSAVPSTTLSAGQFKVFYNVNAGLANNMPASNNANFIIQLNKHSGNYDSQLGFSSNGNIYYRNFNAETIGSQSWRTILDSGNLEAEAKHLDSYSAAVYTSIPINPIAYPLSGFHRSNKLAFIPAANITIEYSTDGGSTWVDYGASNDVKRDLFINKRGSSVNIGPSSGDRTTSMMTRVIVETDGRDAVLDRFLIQLDSGYHNVAVDIYVAHVNSPTTYTKAATGNGTRTWAYEYEINLKHNTSVYYRFSNSYYKKIAFYFRYTSVIAANKSTSSAFCGIMGFTGSYWGNDCKSNFANLDHLYTWDRNQNVTFPANVTAPKFTGPLDVSRVTKDSKVFPGANKAIIEEYTAGSTYNLPSNSYYHIISIQGPDTRYGTQLALGMTATSAYYRNYNNQTWSDWKSIINTNTTYTLGTSGDNVTLTPSSGSAQSITVPYATNAGNVYGAVTNGTTTTTRYGVVFAADPNTSENNTMRKTYDFRINLTNGSTSTTGMAELVLGNEKAKNTSDNKQGSLTLYSSGTSYHQIYVAETNSAIAHTFPATAGTILNSGTTSWTQTVASSATGAYQIGKIKINGSETVVYGVNTDTNTKVTSSANHYAPSTVSGQDKTASASGATAAWSIDVVKGITINTDGKGHITGLSVTSGKIPANPNTNTTYTLGTSGDTVTLTPSSGSVQSITVPYATKAQYPMVTASNELRLYNDNQFKADNHFWIGWAWAPGSHYTPTGGTDTASTSAPNITKYFMGNCSGGGLASVHAKTFILGNGSSPTSSSTSTTIATAATTNRTITLPDASGTVSLEGHTHNYVPNTQAGVNAAINLLGIGDSNPQLADYYVAQYAGGGTATTTYHRRPISALWNTFRALITVTTTGSGNAITSASIADDGNNRKITFTKGSTFSLSSHTHTTLNVGTVGTVANPVYFSNGSPTACQYPSSGNWAPSGGSLPYISGSGVLEIGPYIDFHGTTSTADYDYRLSATTNGLTAQSTGSYNCLTLASPGYGQLRFNTTASGKAYTGSAGIVAYPLSTSGMTLLLQAGGNMVIGGGESASTLYSNNYDNIATVENESLYLASDSSEIHFLTNGGSGVAKMKSGYFLDGDINWGGKDWRTSSGPVDAGLNPILGANRFELAVANGITIERSENSGSSWTTVTSIPDLNKRQFFSVLGNYIKLTDTDTRGMGTNAAKYMLRITLDASTASIYSAIYKFMFNVSTGGSEVNNGGTYESGLYVKIYGRTANNVSSGTDTWTVWNKTSRTWVATNHTSATEANIRTLISGWSGWNTINLEAGSGVITVGSSGSQIRQLRFVFGCDRNGYPSDSSHSASTYGGGGVFCIAGYGGFGWTAPSNLAKYGHMYTWDGNGNTTFPANVTATKFIGPLQGNATSASELYTHYDAGTYGNTYALWWGNTTNSADTTSNYARRNGNATIKFRSDSNGWAEIYLGNALETGTEGSSVGWLGLYSPGTGCHNLSGLATNTELYHYFPSVGGTLLNSGNYSDYAVPYLGNLRDIGSGTPAAATKTYFDSSSVPTLRISGAYNNNGAEYGLIFAKGGSNSYGSVLRWGYPDTYIHMLRKQGGTWKSTDWEKISAGYADKAGSITTVSGTSTGERPVFFAYLGDNSQVVYNTNFQYEPNGGVLRVPKITLGSGTYKATIQANPSTSANRTIQLPNQDGELAVANIIYYNSTGSQNPTVSDAKGYKSYIITIYHGTFEECTGTITVSDTTNTTHCHFPISHIDNSQTGNIRIGAVDIKVEPASSGNSVTFTAYICSHHLAIAGNASTLTNMTTSGTAVIRKIIGFM